ncbi:uncharacterized protein TIGR03905 [Alkalithermobacter thermoalcaliphilus JW-YL-7 = DSM 7308]|uniref:ribonucleoside-diphosphate reductase n=1 Tax=Alkalithermobacter thermoalcaliphilus JW-YL-7 = DSM 7308 TaxID=1121328 RepID=A0A150FRU1_CLOPD|nr:Conserved hypothetical protein CHP03905 [[Clostridium] paradoxum JW-YL-7 = DSM 7308]SHK39061.1 uncharacterized protein TIGR03905 [[Clostridium] paradoxum JW-YL-7 = DSM 7308]
MAKFKTSGVCAKEIIFEIENDIVKSVEFVGGCPGSLVGIKALVEGSHIDDIINKLKGINCGKRKTSCPDQLSKALAEYKVKTKTNE